MIKPAAAGFGLAAALLLGLFALWSFFSPPFSESGEHGHPGESPGGGSRGIAGVGIAESARDSSPLRERIQPREASSPKKKAEQQGKAEAWNEPPDRFLVLGEERAPVANAVLSVYRGSYGSPCMQVETGADGEAVFRALEPGDEIGVKAEGFLPERIGLTARPWPRPYVIVLEKGTILCRGQVMDDLDRTVPGAAVAVYYEGGEARAETDGEGNFVLRVARAPGAPLHAAFQIRVPGFCFLGDGCPVEIPEIPGKLGFRVYRWAALRVNVLDPEGRPLPGASLRLGGPPDRPDRWSLPVGRDVVALSMAGPRRSDEGEADPAVEAGRYLLDKVPPRIPLYLRASHPAYADEEVEVETLQPGERRCITLRFRKRKAVWAFHVKDREGRPLPGAEARISWEDGGGASTYLLETDRQGSFRVDPPPGAWALSVNAKGFLPWRRRFQPAASPPEEGMTIVLEKGGGVIAVRVEDGAGGPAPGMVLFLQNEGVSEGSRMARTDGRGEVRFTGLDPAASYTVKFGFSRPGGFYLSPTPPRKEVPDPPAYRGVRPGDAVRVFRLVPPAMIQGTVRTDAAEAKGKRLTLSFVEARGGRHPPVFSIGKALDENGAFLFTGLPPGRYHLWMYGVEGGGDLHAPMMALDLREGETLGPLELEPR